MRRSLSEMAGRNGRCRFALHASVRARSRFRFHLLRRFLPPCLGGQICYLLAAIFILLIIFTYAPGIRAPFSLSSVNYAFALFSSSSLFPPMFLLPFPLFLSPFYSPPFAPPPSASRPSPSPLAVWYSAPAPRSRSRYCGARIARASTLGSRPIGSVKLSSVRYEASDKFSIDTTSFGRSAPIRARRREGNAPGVVFHFDFISRPRAANFTLHRLFTPLGQLLQSRWAQSTRLRYSL